jgi:hypothetical protein
MAMSQVAKTDKTTRWAFTAYEAEWHLFELMNDKIAEWGWQLEICPKTQRKHYQGYMRTKTQQRFSSMKTIFPGVHLEQAKNWDALLQYCKKEDTAVAGTQVAQVNTSQPMTMAQALIKLATYVMPRPPIDYLNTDDPIKRKRQLDEDEYWLIVNTILDKIDHNTGGLWTQPQYVRAWVHTRQTWLKKAQRQFYLSDDPFGEEEEDEQTDRQTDSLPPNAFEN